MIKLRKLTEGQFHTIWTEAVGKDGYDKKLFQNILQSLKDKGLIYDRKKIDEECISISIHMEIDGKFENGYKKTYNRGTESWAFTLDDFAHIIFLWERKFFGGTTYAMDGLLQEAEKKLPKKDGETAQSVFEKYWVNLEKTINDEFILLNQGEGEGNKKYTLFPAEGDYLKYCISNNLNSFTQSPLPVKYAFLYFLHKYIMNSSIDELKADLNKVPDYIKKIVNDMVMESQKPYNHEILESKYDSDLIKDEITFPDDLDSILVEAERLGWVFHNGIWVNSGWSDKTTAELYNSIKK